MFDGRSESDAPTLRRDGIFYVTDSGFALPTVAGALALRRKTPAARADIRIIVTGTAEDSLGTLRDWLAPRGIFVDFLPQALFSGFDQTLFNKTHVPMPTLGRFFMLDCVPDLYDRILYLDGDTWPVGDPAALLDVPLPEGHLAAAEDQSFFYRNEMGGAGRAVRAYFAGLGIAPERGYFNAGVLLASAATWRGLSREAYEFFCRNPARCRYHDQSALNAVAGERRVRLAPRWNAISQYAQWGLRQAGPAEVLHFCGGVKPWNFPEDGFFPVYAERFAELAGLLPAMPPYSARAATAARAALRRNRLKLATLLRHRRRQRQRLYDELVETADIA